ARHLGAGATLGLEGKVEILELGLRAGGGDADVELVGELALPADLLADGGAPRLQLAQVGEPLLELAQLRIVEAARHLLAVAGDEWNGRPLVDQPDSGDDLCWPRGDIGCNDGGDAFQNVGHAASMDGWTQEARQ